MSIPEPPVGSRRFVGWVGSASREERYTPIVTIGDGLAGRYNIFAELACGGMAMVYLGQLEGGHGFRRSVAVKRMHPQYARDASFRDMFLDEARLVAKIRHPNVVPTIDIVSRDDLLLIVMEFVEGESIAQLLATSKIAVPPRVAATIAHDALCGLHAAHELTNDDGELLHVIHRDVSPANVLVGKDGMSRILDFGVAKAAGRSAPTKDGTIKGKVPYMPPEQLWGSELDRTVDIYATSVVLWEMLAGRRLFKGDSDAETMKNIVEQELVPPSTFSPEAAPLDEVVMRGMSRDPTKRFATAIEMAKALEKALPGAPRLEVADWVTSIAQESLAKRSALLRGMQRGDPAPAPQDIVSLVSVLTASTPRTAVGQSFSNPPSPAPTSGSRRNVAVVVAGALAVVLTLGGVVAMRSRSLLRRADAQTSTSANALVAATPPPSPSPSPSAAPPPDPPPPPETAAPPPPSASGRGHAPSAPRRTGPPRSPSPPPAAKPKANCQPPYTLDAAGERHFKVECL
jgi:eukaryotic-like serine/threonine-protein kinase